MYHIINQNILSLNKRISDELIEDDESKREKIEKCVQENVMIFLKSSFEEIFNNQKTLRKREALNLFGNKKEEKVKSEKKVRKLKVKEQKIKVQLIPLSGDLSGFYLYNGTDILLIRNGNEKYSAVASYKNESVKSLSSEDVEFCKNNKIEILNMDSYLAI